MDEAKPHRRRVKIRVRTKVKTWKAFREDWRKRLRAAAKVIGWTVLVTSFAVVTYLVLYAMGGSGLGRR